MEIVRVRMLGGFSVSVGERFVDEDAWRLRKAAGLVKLLALEPGYRMHRERVMDLLWPERDAKAQANNLSYALHVARRILGPGAAYLRLRGNLLELCPEGEVRVDVGAFEEAAAAARRTHESAAYRAAADLYAGDLLPGDLYEPWAEVRREGLRGTYAALLIELAGLHEQREEFDEAIEALRQAAEREPAHEGIGTDLMRLCALGGQRESALEQYERLEEALRRGPGTRPKTASRRLYAAILTGEFPPERSSPEEPPPKEPPGERHNLPAARTSFVGREREALEVKRLLCMTRLLTLTGAGGSGKTRLALEVARDLAGAYPDGAWLVELASLSEGALVPQEVAGVLGVPEQSNRPITDTLVDALSSKDLLLVLDNCEHLVDAVAGLVDDLLDACPRLRILATSREALDVRGETSWIVPTLALPGLGEQPGPEELEEYGSARLFVDRVRQRDPAFALTTENARTVAEVCRKLDGIPLVIELAAARVGVLDVEQILERLEDSLKLLTGGGRTASQRQRTLRGALDWGYDLLDDPEKRLFGRLSVFAGGWTLEAAEAVGTEGDVLDLLSRLVDKSLVVAEASPRRYRMLEPVRQYGREKLAGEAEQVRQRHAAFFLALGEEAEPELVGPEQHLWMERLETEHDNLRWALAWFRETGASEAGQRLGGALGEFWRVRGHLGEGLRWIESSLSGEQASSFRAKALVHGAWIAWERMDFERATAFSEEALVLSRRLEDKACAAAALYHLGMVAIYGKMQPKEAWALFEEAVALRRDLGDETGTGRALQKMGLILVVGQNFDSAMTLFEESLALARKTRDMMGVAFALWLGGLVYLGRDDHGRVKALCDEGLNVARQLGHTHATVLLLHVRAASAGSQGQPVRSARLWGAAESLLDTLGLTLGPAERYHYGPYIAAAKDQLDETSWGAAWAEGREMTAEQAVEYAVSEKESEVSAPEEVRVDQPIPEITKREKEIAALIACGLSNREIASEFTISERTVEKHIANVLKKLDLPSRYQVAIWMRERQLSETG